ncbi:MAG: hypothetical protein ACNA7Q_08290 [Rhodobacterales bacterium]
MTRIMEARVIHKSYGRVSVLENVDFDLEESEAHIATVRGAGALSFDIIEAMARAVDDLSRPADPGTDPDSAKLIIYT